MVINTFFLFSVMNKPFSREAFKNFRDALGITGEGMLGIFIVMLIFYVIIILLSKIKIKAK